MPKLKELVEKFKITPDPQGKKKLITEVFRSSYAFVNEPYVNKDNPNDEPKYSIQMIFDKSNEKALKPIVQAAANAAASKWGEMKNWPKMKYNVLNLAIDESELEEKHYIDTMINSAKSKNKPGIVGPDAKPLMDADDFYSGCDARASITAFAYDTAQNKGVSFGLNNVMKIKDNERLDGRAAAEEDFSDYAEETDDVSEDGF